MIVEIWRIFADLKFINSNTKKQHYGFKWLRKVQEWKSRMLTTVAYGKRVRCNDGVDPDKAT